jgi:hypothetical protein
MILREVENLPEVFMRSMLVRLQRVGSGQFVQQLLGLVDQNGQALRADVSGAVTMRQA